MLGAAACVAVVAVVASFAYGPKSPVGLPNRGSVPGTCHAAADPIELTATISDTSPAVPCDQPHQTETLWMQPIAGSLARQKSRPNPELLVATFVAICDDYWRIRTYMGADPHDDNWGVATLLKVPTPAEWDSGDRTLRCDGSPGSWGINGPQISVALRGVLRRKDSARFRLCRRSGNLVTCDQLHDAEGISPNIIMPYGPWPGTTMLTADALAACEPLADAYLAAPLASRGDLLLTVDVPTEAQWSSGNRSVNCWLANVGGQFTTTTVRGGLR